MRNRRRAGDMRRRERVAAITPTPAMAWGGATYRETLVVRAVLRAPWSVEGARSRVAGGRMGAE